MLAVVPRLIGRDAYYGSPPLGDEFWRGTTLNLPDSAPFRWIDVISGNTLDTALAVSTKTPKLGSILKSFPVALLCNEEVVAELPSVEENSDARAVEHIA